MRDIEIVLQKKEKQLEWLYRWIRLGQEGISINQLLLNRGYRNVAFYGLNDVSVCLLYELEKEKINVKCIFDQNADSINTVLPVLSLTDFAIVKPLDAIIICVARNFDNIKTKVREKVDCKVITFEDILYEV